VPGRYDLSVLDLASNAQSASDDMIVATPTLIRTHPLPERRFVGDVSATERVALALGFATPTSDAAGEL
jgi:circadian clock protein KaiB